MTEKKNQIESEKKKETMDIIKIKSAPQKKEKLQMMTTTKKKDKLYEDDNSSLFYHQCSAVKFVLPSGRLLVIQL